MYSYNKWVKLQWAEKERNSLVNEAIRNSN